MTATNASQTMKKNGFTLVEILIAMAIIGILAGVGIPKYQEYVIKSRITAVLAYGDGLKADAHEYYLRNGRFPHDNGNGNRTLVQDANVSAYEYWAPAGTNREFIWIHIYLTDKVYPGSSTAKAMILQGQYVNGDITWSCRRHNGLRRIPDEYNPAQCNLNSGAGI